MRWPLIRNMPHHFSFDFVKLAPFAAILSAILLVGSGVSMAVNGLNLGTDFKGGTSIDVATPGSLDLGKLRSEMHTILGEEAGVQGYGDGKSAQVRFRTEQSDAMSEGAHVKVELAAKFPGMTFGDVQTVGEKVSGELLQSGFIALALAVLLMLAYIWFRFQLQFGLGAVIAIFHDVALTLGLLSVLKIEFSMVSIPALLTVIGYSMNEKVITFDRLRENLRKHKKRDRAGLRDIINLSENERLSRTIITGTTALLALSGMLFLGGPALFPMILTMVMGIILGTYSSIYVALPVILLWGVKREDGEATPIKVMTPRTGI